jgi:hypothetical protein
MSSNAARNNAYDAELGELLPGAACHSTPGLFVVTLPCSECRTPEDYTMSRKLPPLVVAKHFKSRGWKIGRKANGHVCPNHSKEKTMTKISPAIHSAAAPTPAEVSDKARAARREAMTWLGDEFDIAAGRYRGKESDATIAEAVGLSVEAVAKLREEFYGPLKVPSELEQLGKEIAALRESAEAEAKALRAQIETSERNTLNRLIALESRRDQLARKFG